MAVTLTGSPETFSPAYNPLWYEFDSTNKNLQGFRYIVDLFDDTSGSPVLIERYRIAPRPGDGRCEFNCSRVLSTYVTNQTDIDLMGDDPTQCYIEYSIEVGESYNTDWDYSDFEFYSNPGSPFTAYTQLRKYGPAVAHPFVVGSQINVVQDDTTPLWPAINGLHTVVAVPDAYTIVIDLPWWMIGSGPVTPGTVYFANNDKTDFPGLLAVRNRVAFNGAVSHELYRTYDQDVFGLSTLLLGQAITSCPMEFTVRPTTRMGFNWFNNYSTNQKYLYCMNDAGTVKRVDIADGNTPMNYTAVGPATINSTITSYVSGPVGNLILSDTKWYEIWCVNISGQTISQTYRFNINSRCINYREYEVVFMDRLGSMASFSFTLRSDERMTVKKDDHKFMLGGFVGGKWTYGTTDAGSRTISSDAENFLTLRTAWLTDEESVYFQELISSPLTWAAVDGGDFYPVICTESGTPIDRHPFTKNIAYTINMRYANNNLINI